MCVVWMRANACGGGHVFLWWSTSIRGTRISTHRTAAPWPAYGTRPWTCARLSVTITKSRYVQRSNGVKGRTLISRVVRGTSCILHTLATFFRVCPYYQHGERLPEADYQFIATGRWWLVSYLAGRGDFCIKRLKISRVTHGEDLCKHSHESLMGRIYAKHATSYSWGGFMQSRFA